jgi:hypothetical protein
MPLIIAPYTLGSQLGVAGPPPVGGAAYYHRRKRFIAYILTAFLLVIL